MLAQVSKAMSNRKKDVKIEKKIRFRSKAIQIFTTGSMSYAEIPRKMKADCDPEDLRGGNVYRIRRNQKGNLMLELERFSMSIAKYFRDQVKNLLEESSTTPGHKHEIT